MYLCRPVLFESIELLELHFTPLTMMDALITMQFHTQLCILKQRSTIMDHPVQQRKWRAGAVFVVLSLHIVLNMCFVHSIALLIGVYYASSGAVIFEQMPAKESLKLIVIIITILMFTSIMMLNANSHLIILS